MNTRLLQVVVAARIVGADLTARLREERGEGVISTAIAVLIMALLGALMWVAFRGVFQGATGNIENSVNSIGGG